MPVFLPKWSAISNVNVMSSAPNVWGSNLLSVVRVFYRVAKHRGSDKPCFRDTK
jgi:hypothetical protein